MARQSITWVTLGCCAQSLILSPRIEQVPGRWYFFFHLTGTEGTKRSRDLEEVKWTPDGCDLSADDTADITQMVIKIFEFDKREPPNPVEQTTTTTRRSCQHHNACIVPIIELRLISGR
jgi:hypothetical protein